MVGGVAAGAGLVLLHLVEALVGEGDPPAPAVAAEAAVVGDARVDGGVRARDGAGEPACDVAGGAAAAVAVDGVVAVPSKGVEVAAGAELAEVPFGGGGVDLREGLDHRRRAARLGDLAEDPPVDGDDAARARHQRRRHAPGLADVAAGAAAGARDRAERARLGLHAGMRTLLVEGQLVAEVARRAADGGARVGAARVLLGPHVTRDAALDLPASAAGPAAEPRLPLPFAAEGGEEAGEGEEDESDERPRPEHQRAARRSRTVNARYPALQAAATARSVVRHRPSTCRTRPTTARRRSGRSQPAATGRWRRAPWRPRRYHGPRRSAPAGAMAGPRETGREPRRREASERREDRGAQVGSEGLAVLGGEEPREEGEGAGVVEGDRGQVRAGDSEQERRERAAGEGNRRRDLAPDGEGRLRLGVAAHQEAAEEREDRDGEEGDGAPPDAGGEAAVGLLPEDFDEVGERAEEEAPARQGVDAAQPEAPGGGAVQGLEALEGARSRPERSEGQAGQDRDEEESVGEAAEDHESRAVKPEPARVRCGRASAFGAGPLTGRPSAS